MKRTSSPYSSMSNINGFTLIELMITLVVAAILLGLVVPNMRSFILNNRLTSTANLMLRSIQTARTEAAKLQQDVVICASANPTASSPSCSKTNVTGWIVFQDTNNNWDRDSGEPLIETQTFESDKITLWADNDMRLSFAATGFANLPGAMTPSSAVVMCDSRGNQTISGQSTARGISIANTGRAHATRVTSDIATLLGTATCP